MNDAHAITATGDPRHPEHEAWLLALGKATYAAARVAGVSFDILRVFGGVDSAEMYSDPLGILLKRLKKLRAASSSLPGIDDFIASVESSKRTRNDLFHALPVKDGLHRRVSDDLTYVRNFFTPADLQGATNELISTWHMGSRLLYHDGGAAVKIWAAQS